MEIEPNNTVETASPSKARPKFDLDRKLEKLGTGADTIRLWITQAWKIGLMMAKGAYLLSERRRLFGQLGEEVYYKIAKGEFQNTELDPIVSQLDKLTKKVEIEETRIRSIRFGKGLQNNTTGLDS